MESLELLVKVEWDQRLLMDARNMDVFISMRFGGAAQVLAEKIKSVDNVYLKEKFGSPEAIWELSVEEFPCVVTMDSHGNSLHEKVEGESSEIFKTLI